MLHRRSPERCAPTESGRAPVARSPALLPTLAAGTLFPLFAADSPPCESSDEFKRALRLQPAASAYNLEGERLTGEGKSDCARRAFEKAVKLDRNSWQARLNLGRAYRQGGQLDQALRHLEAAVSLRPEHLDARLALGALFSELGRPEGAAREFEAAVAIKPASGSVRRQYAQALLAQGRYAAATAQLGRALELDPDSVDSLVLLGLAHSRAGRPEQALAPLQRVVAAEPDHFLGRFNLAAAYAQTDRYAEAASHFREALRIDPVHPEARLAAAKTEVNLGRFEQALELTQRWEGAIPASLDTFEVLYLRAVASRGTGKLGEAEAIFREAADLRPGHAETQRELGLLLTRRRAYPAARERLERARDLEPDSREIRFELIGILRELGDTEALRRETTAFEERKRRSENRNLAARVAARGAAYLQNGKPAAALEEYRQAIRRAPGDPKLHYGRALALAALERQTARIEALNQALALDPGLAEARNELGVAFTETKRYAEAETALQAALAAKPHYVAARSNLGVLYAKLGRHGEAEALFRRAIEDDRTAAHLRINHALALASLGRFEEARAVLRKAKELDPSDPKADRALALIGDRPDAETGTEPATAR